MFATSPLSNLIRRPAMIGAIAALLTLATIPVSAQTAPPTASATAGTASGTCPDAFSTDAQTRITALQIDPAKSDPAAIGTAALQLIALRYTYEDHPTPGCESATAHIVRVIGLSEDLMIATLATQIDTTNAGTYADFLSKNFQPRLSALSGSATASGISTAPVMTASATSAIPTVTAIPGASCTNQKTQGQVSADVGGFPNLTNATVNQLATAALTVIKIRYTYEDEIAPAGCGAALEDGRQFMALSEDTLLLNLLARADTANVDRYESFRTGTVVPRIQTLNSHFSVDLGFATPTALGATSTP